ncbi:hypothetical protein TWF696_001057 [Orbilia brochopaga]|uniref:C2H2-type domain-containing protein n=1 Tax=Orbilia brochopaga TaxID=3140254 RepID=A0AAV9VG80_9PEZI
MESANDDAGTGADGCIYYPGNACLLPMSRILETISLTQSTESPFRDDIMEMHSSKTICDCPPHSRCRRLDDLPPDFAFVVSRCKYHGDFKVIVQDKVLQDIIVEAIRHPIGGNFRYFTPIFQHFEGDPPVACWDGAYLLTRYDDLKRSLQAAADATQMGYIHHEDKVLEVYKSLELLVDGFLQCGELAGASELAFECTRIASSSLFRFINAADALAVLSPKHQDSSDEPHVDSGARNYSSPAENFNTRSSLRALQPQQAEKLRQAKAEMWTFFIEEYDKVMGHTVSRRVRGYFLSPLGAWKHGLDVLRSILDWCYLPRGLDAVMCFLCICRAMSRLLDENIHIHSTGQISNQQYREKFGRDLSRWSILLNERDRQLFKAATQDIWDADETANSPQLSNLDHCLLFRTAQDVVSRLGDEAEQFLKIPVSERCGQLARCQKGLPMSSCPSPATLDPGDTMARHHRVLIWFNSLQSDNKVDLQPHDSPISQPECHIVVDLETPAADRQNPITRIQPDLTPALDDQQDPNMQPRDAEQEIAIYEQDNRGDGHQIQENMASTSTRHMTSHAYDQRTAGRGTKRRYQCRGCTKEYTRKEYADRHYLEVHEALMHCDLCNKKYNRRYYEVHVCNPKKRLRRAK